MKLLLETKKQPNEGVVIPGVEITPPLDEDYWSHRVRLSEEQAIVGFPKFGTTGIGFAVEEDWNTNLPYVNTAVDIYEHIRHNKGDDSISDEDAISAIEMVRNQVTMERFNLTSQEFDTLTDLLNKAVPDALTPKYVAVRAINHVAEYWRKP